MSRMHKLWSLPCIVVTLALALSLPVRAYQPSQAQAFTAPAGGTFTFVKEDKEGSNPKFDLVDERGVRWKVKLREEAQSETAAWSRNTKMICPRISEYRRTTKT